MDWKMERLAGDVHQRRVDSAQRDECQTPSAIPFHCEIQSIPLPAIFEWVLTDQSGLQTAVDQDLACGSSFSQISACMALAPPFHSFICADANQNLVARITAD